MRRGRAVIAFVCGLGLSRTGDYFARKEDEKDRESEFEWRHKGECKC